MRRDFIANNKVGLFYAQARREQGAGAYISTVIDHAAGRAGRVHGYEWATNMMGILYVNRWPTAVATATITLTFQHSIDNSTWATYGTIAAATQASGEDLFLFEVRDFRRYVRLSGIVANGHCDFACFGIFDRSRGEPVYQNLASELAFTITGTP